MTEQRLIELLVKLHRGLPRQGPGTTASTLRALSLCQSLPTRPDVLDVGCGAGVQTLDLARATGGTVTATDLFPAFLDQLREKTEDEGLTERITIRQADMNALPFAPESFDLIWSEGAVYIMGFDSGLTSWRPLVRPGGWLAVTEVSWLTPNPSEECRRFWAEGYPGMRGVEENLAAARSLGWEPAGHFTLPRTAWTEDYYAPLAARLPSFEAAHAHDSEALEVAAMTRYEMDLLQRSLEHYNYVFYVLKKTD